MTQSNIDELVAATAGYGMALSTAFAMCTLYLSAAETHSQASADSVRHSNHAAMVELTTTSACCAEILGQRSAPTKTQNSKSSPPKSFSELSFDGPPVVT